MKRLAMILVVLAGSLLACREAQAIGRRVCRPHRAYYGAPGVVYPYYGYTAYRAYAYPVYSYGYLPAYPYGFYGHPTYSYYGYAPGYAWYW